MDVRIVVLQRGWVVVGIYTRNGLECRLEKASVIRKWGTSKGLGELRAGPLAETVLDACGTVEFHRLTEVMSIQCNPTAWSKHLV